MLEGILRRHTHVLMVPTVLFPACFSIGSQLPVLSSCLSNMGRREEQVRKTRWWVTIEARMMASRGEERTQPELSGGPCLQSSSGCVGRGRG